MNSKTERKEAARRLKKKMSATRVGPTIVGSYTLWPVIHSRLLECYMMIGDDAPSAVKGVPLIDRILESLRDRLISFEEQRFCDDSVRYLINALDAISSEIEESLSRSVVGEATGRKWNIAESSYQEFLRREGSVSAQASSDREVTLTDRQATRKIVAGECCDLYKEVGNWVKNGIDYEASLWQARHVKVG
jgi:hypothetical protein